MDKEIPLSERRKRLRIQIIKYGAILTASVILFIWMIRFLRPTIDIEYISVSTVDIGVIEMSVGASGKVVPLTEEIIVSPINSRILELYKNPGEQVHKGDAILKLELASVEAEYNQKLDELQIKNGKLVQLKANIDNKISELEMQEKIKEMKLMQMATELKNEQYLDSIGASTPDKVREAAISYEVSKLELEQLKERIANEVKVSQAELKVQQLELNIFDRSLEQTRKLLEDARILSPLDATLTFINNQIGSQVAAGTQIAIISDLSKFKVEAEIADGYGERIAPGARTVVKAGETELEGSILNIVPSVKNGIINFTILLDQPDHPKLRSGLRSDVHVKYEVRDNVMRIKNSSYYMGEGSYILWVMEGDQAHPYELRLGKSSYEYVEVVGGIKEGDEVIISDMSRYNSRKSIRIKR